MKKFIFALLPVMVALFALTSCSKDDTTAVFVTFGVKSVSGDLSYFQDKNKVEAPFKAEFAKSGMEKVEDNIYLLRAETSNANAVSIAKKCAEAADAKLSGFSTTISTLVLTVEVSSDYGKETVFSKDYAKK